MLSELEESAIQSDAYIDALLAGHAREPMPIRRGNQTPSAGVRHVIRLLERGLPRVHPSFLFEERLAEQLRAAHGDPAMAVLVDRRLLFGGAIAGGVSIAGAAMLAWLRRPRTELGRG